MEASSLISGSYDWQSILKGKDVLMRGVKWRVGCGDFISVWVDARLPSLEYSWILSTIIEGFQDIRVCDLINPNPISQNSKLVCGLFSPQEVDLILSTPLRSRRTEDKLIWFFNYSGLYFVKFDYKFLVKENISPNLSIRSLIPQQDLQRKIWGAMVPNKVRNFMWHSCMQSL